MADSEDRWRPFTTTMGVELEYAAFPHGMYWDIMARALKENPDPEPPTKTIEVFDGTEEMDDLEDPVYLLEQATARRARNNTVGVAALDLCVRVVGGLEQYEDEIARAARYADEQPPDDDDGRRVWFLNKLALRTVQDWEIIKLIQSFSQIEEDEVRQQAENFPGDVEGPEGA